MFVCLEQIGEEPTNQHVFDCVCILPFNSIPTEELFEWSAKSLLRPDLMHRRGALGVAIAVAWQQMCCVCWGVTQRSYHRDV